MADYDIDFINEFNGYYPFERYIVKEPKQINYLFDDVVLTELFVPSTEIKPLVDEDGGFHGYSEIDNDEIYVKLKCSNSEFRMAYYDFEEHIREEIRHTILTDFGTYEWESLYMDYEDENEYDELIEALYIQKQLITEKYGICNVKPDFDITHTIDLVNNMNNRE